MLPADSVLVDALRSHVTSSVFAVARYQGLQTVLQVDPVGSVSFRGNSRIQADTKLTVVGQGDSLIPTLKTDPLAPYGQEVALWKRVRVRDTTWDVPLGVYRVTRVGDASRRLREGVTLDWSVSVTLKDRFEQIEADNFLAVDSPQPGNTVWDEIRRLSPIPVVEALGDADVPASLVYDSRLDAIEELMRILGGVPHLTREGVLTARVSDAWLTSETAVFDLPGVISWSDEMVNDFYNQVQVSNPNDKTIVAYATISDPWNPLSVQRAGGRTYKHASPVYTTQEAAAAGAATVLQRVSERRSRTVRVQCGPEALLLELGDFGWVRDPVQRRAVLGEVSGLQVPLDPTAPVGVDLIVSVDAPLVDDEIEMPAELDGLYPSTGLYPDTDLYPEG